eukprot:31623-Eustigmatos_ZCMA.PRE.1
MALGGRRRQDVAPLQSQGPAGAERGNAARSDHTKHGRRQCSSYSCENVSDSCSARMGAIAAMNRHTCAYRSLTPI